MDPPPRRRAAAVATTTAAAQEQRSGNTAAAAGAGTTDKGMTAQSLAEFARQRKLERERKREEEAARLRAAKLAAAAQRSGEAGAGPAWNPGAASAGASSRPAQLARSRPSHGASHSRAGSARSRGSLLVSSSSSGSGSIGAAAGSSLRTSGGGERQSVGSGDMLVAAAGSGPPSSATVAEAARHHKELPAASPPAATAAPGLLPQVPRLPLARMVTAGGAGDGGQASARSTGGWSPRKTPRPQQVGGAGAAAPSAGLPRLARPAQSAQEQAPRRASQPGSLSARGPQNTALAAALQPQAAQQQQGVPPLGSARQHRLGLPPPPAAATAGAAAGGGTGPHPSTQDAELDSAELEARRVQRLLGWSALLVQATATVAAERVLLGPAALPDSQARSAEELPLSFGWQSPTDSAARAAASRQQVAAALAALEQARQAKLALLVAAEKQGQGQLSAAERQLLEDEAAADLQGQSLLAHWGMQAAWEARQAAAQGDKGQICGVPPHY